MASGMTIEELKAASRAAGLSKSEENFVCFNWATSESWQEYLTNLYPTPPLNKLLKWKKKFYKTHQDPSFDVNSVKVDQVLSGAVQTPPSGPPPSSGFSRSNVPHINRVGNPPSARTLMFLTPLTFMCLCAGMVKTVIAAVGSSKDPMATVLLAGSLFLRLYCCFGFPPIKMWPLSQVGDSIVNDGFPYFEQVLKHDAMHAVLFFLLTGMMPNSLPLMASPLLTGCLVLAQILREGTGIPVFITSLGFVRRFTSLMDRKRFQVLQLRADLEVYFGVFYIVYSLIRMNISLSEFLLPAYLYWQLQKLRFQSCPYSQASIRRVDAMITSVTNNQACPKVVGMIYSKIRNFCIRQVQPPEPSANQTPSCTVM